jgi:hypothetical protein
MRPESDFDQAEKVIGKDTTLNEMAHDLIWDLILET